MQEFIVKWIKSCHLQINITCLSLKMTSLGFNISNATGTLIYTSSGATTISVTGKIYDISRSVTSNNAGWNLVANP